jgi:ribosomal protein S27AE
VPDEEDESFSRITRRCPHCGARSRTLGTSCPRCGESYRAGGLLDVEGHVAWLYGLAALAVVAFVVILFIRSWVAGTLASAGLFIALVAAIGVSNWLAQR